MNVAKPTLTVVDVGVQRVNITWTQLSSTFNASENFTLKISSNNNVIQELPVNGGFHEFCSDEDNSSCTIFTFSLSSTLLSPILRDCVIESNTVQRPLPALPNITTLESSLNISLSKQAGGVLLTVSFLVCDN